MKPVSILKNKRLRSFFILLVPASICVLSLAASMIVVDIRIFIIFLIMTIPYFTALFGVYFYKFLKMNGRMIVNDDHLLFIVHKKKIIIPFGTKIVLTRGETDWGQGGIRSGKFGWFYMVFLRKKGEQEAFPFCVCNPECLKLIVQYLDCTSNFDLFEVYDRQ